MNTINVYLNGFNTIRIYTTEQIILINSDYNMNK